MVKKKLNADYFLVSTVLWIIFILLWYILLPNEKHALWFYLGCLTMQILNCLTCKVGSD